MTPLDDRTIPPGSRRQYDLNISADEARPVPRMVNLIISEALITGAQQVHVHTGELTIRFLRADEWTEHMSVPAPVLAPLINRLRVMANLDRIEHNEKQEGTIEVQSRGLSAVLRMVVQFTETGEEEVYLHLPSAEQG